MTRVSLSDTGEYQLVNSAQDVRGYNVLDRNGQPVGTVESMLIDTDAELVTTLVLEDGTELAARDVTIGESVVYLDRGVSDMGTTALGTAASAVATGTATGTHEGVTVFDDGGRVVRRERVEAVGSSVTDFGDEFRAHHETTFGPMGRSYDETSGAYRYGYTAAHEDAHRNRPFSDAEAELRSGYSVGDYDADREAVRYGYSRAQRRSR